MIFLRFPARRRPIKTLFNPCATQTQHKNKKNNYTGTPNPSNTAPSIRGEQRPVSDLAGPDIISPGCVCLHRQGRRAACQSEQTKKKDLHLIGNTVGLERALTPHLHLKELCTSEEASSPEQRLSDLPHRTILTTAADSGGVEGGGGGSTNRR